MQKKNHIPSCVQRDVNEIIAAISNPRDFTYDKISDIERAIKKELRNVHEPQQADIEYSVQKILEQYKSCIPTI